MDKNLTFLEHVMNFPLKSLLNVFSNSHGTTIFHLLKLGKKEKKNDRCFKKINSYMSYKNVF